MNISPLNWFIGLSVMILNNRSMQMMWANSVLPTMKERPRKMPCLTSFLPSFPAVHGALCKTQQTKRACPVLPEGV